MSIYYRIVQRIDPREPEVAGKFYASGASIGRMGLNELPFRSFPGNVADILYDLCEAIVYFIGQGRNVDLGTSESFSRVCATPPEAKTR